MPTTWPGFRLPHVWLEDGSAIHDHFGPGYTLLRFDGGRENLSDLVTEFQKYGAPIDCVEFDDAHAVAVYEGYELFLLRPDLHIVWRGNTAPGDPVRLAALATGHTAART